MKLRKLGIALGAILMAFGVFAPSASAVLPDGTQNTPPGTGNKYFGRAIIIRSYGSDTTYFMLNDLGLAYMESEGCDAIATRESLADPLGPTVRPPSWCKPWADQPANVITTENYDHNLILNYHPEGSTEGKVILCWQDDPGGTNPKPARWPLVDIARSSSAPDTPGRCPEPTENVFRYIGFAGDGIAPATMPAGEVGYADGQANFSTAQLQRIFNPTQCVLGGGILWDVVDDGISNGSAPAQPVLAWSIQSGSGTQSSWDGFMGVPSGRDHGECSPAGKIIFENNDAPIVAAINTPGSAENARPGDIIYPYSVGRYTVNAAGNGTGIPTLVLKNVDGIAPTPANIGSGNFPYSRLVYNILRRANNGLVPNAINDRPFNSIQVNEFAGIPGWICKPGNRHSSNEGRDYGQQVVDIIQDNGFVVLANNPVTQNKCVSFDVTNG